jgi:hypothetical protein
MVEQQRGDVGYKMPARFRFVKRVDMWMDTKTGEYLHPGSTGAISDRWFKFLENCERYRRKRRK